jgi:hypothetical protein
MKIVLKTTLLVFLISFVSCEPDIKLDEDEKVIPKINYFYDDRTGLCFAEVISVNAYGFKIRSISCVPCDSLKDVLHKKYQTK